MRLGRDLRHKYDYAACYRKLAEEATILGEIEVAQMIHAAAEYSARQNEQLENALSLYSDRFDLINARLLRFTRISFCPSPGIPRLLECEA